MRDLIRRRAPGVAAAAELSDSLRLGSGGAGLDSITVVELLDGAPLTVGRLVAGVRAALLRASG